MDNRQENRSVVRRVRAVPPGGGYGAPPPGRDIFPYLIGGLLTAAVLGIVLIVWLMASPGNVRQAGVLPTSTPFAGVPAEFPTANVPVGVQTGIPAGVATIDIAAPLAEPTGSAPPVEEAPRITLGAFKALWDDPATRPVILDTRSKQQYNQGHIPGALSMPATELAANVGILPKDKLIVAYCS